MRQYTILLRDPVGRELDRLRAEGRAPGLDDALATALDLLQALPEIGQRVRRRGQWSRTDRRWGLGQTGFVLFYRVHAAAELIEVLLVWHEKRRPPRLP